MNKFIKMLLVLSFLNISLFAEISEKELNNYWDLSQAKRYLDGAQRELTKKAFNRLLLMQKISPKPVSEIKIEAKSFASRRKYANTFKKVFKTLDVLVYKKIIEFYNSDAGRKLAKHVVVSKKNIIKIKNTVFSQKKLTLLKDISNEFNIVSLTIQLKKKLINTIFLDSSEYTRDDAIDNLEKLKPKLVEYNDILMKIMYFDFNENELTKVLIYAKTDAGKIEMKLIFDAIFEFTKISSVEVDHYIEKKLSLYARDGTKGLR